MHLRISILSLIVFIAAICNPVFSIELLNNQQALEEMFGKNAEVIVKQITFSEDEINAVKEKLDGSLNHFKSKDETINDIQDYQFFIGISGNDTTGIALIEEQPGKWGPVKFMILLDAQTMKVKNLVVMAYKEKRGRPIARKNFLKQFIGKGSENKFRLRRDIRGISGATVSSDCACFAVKKVIALIETGRKKI